MELNCPNCTTHFTVPDDAIGPKGRKLKCAKCDHTWRQMLPGQAAAAPPEPPPEPDMADDAMSDAMGGMDDMGMDDTPTSDDSMYDGDDGYGDDPGFDTPMDDDPAPDMPMEMAPGAKGASRSDPLDGYDSDIPMESGMGRSSSSILDDDPLSGLDFGDGAAFGSESGDDDDEMSSFNSRSDLDSREIDDLLASGPEPIADLFGRDNMDDDDFDDGNGKGKGGLIALVLVLIMAGLGAGAWFGRSAVVSMIPALEPVYAMLGVEMDMSSTGLVFQDVTSDRQSVNGVDMFVVRGFITNQSDGRRTLPYLSLILFDRTDTPVQRVVSEPPKEMLEPGETTGFRLKMENPSASATRFDVFWTKATPTAAGAGAQGGNTPAPAGADGHTPVQPAGQAPQAEH